MLQGLSDLGSISSFIDTRCRTDFFFLPSAINTLVTSMWADRCTAPLNLVYFGYALGALLSLVIVQSFQADLSPSDQPARPLNLVGPYTITSIFCLICSIGFTFIAWKQRKDRHREKQRVQKSVEKIGLDSDLASTRSLNRSRFWQRCSPTTCGEGYFVYGFVLFSLILTFNFCFGKFARQESIEEAWNRSLSFHGHRWRRAMFHEILHFIP